MKKAIYILTISISGILAIIIVIPVFYFRIAWSLCDIIFDDIVKWIN